MTDHRRKEFRGLDGRERMKPKTDREIVEYLDKSVECWHELKIPEDYDGWMVCKHCKAKFWTEKESKNPTPDLDWMLEKLGNKYGEAISISYTKWRGEWWCAFNIDYTKIESSGSKQEWFDNTSHAETPTLALRGAVEKMAEESK